MEARTVDATGERPPARGPDRTRRRRRSRRWLRGGRGDHDTGRLVEQLEAEVALLREENARLKIRGARGGGERPWDERMRDLVPGEQPPDLRGDDAWALLTECQVLRTALVDACRDVEAAMAQIRGRLEALPEPGRGGKAAS
jgi:hypothetical protein